MKKLFLASIVFILSACSATPQSQERTLSNEVHKTPSGEKWTVNQLRDDYLKKTGKELKSDNAIDCGWNGSCFYNKWASSYDAGIKQYQEENRKNKEQENYKCKSSPDCVKSLEVEKYSSLLKNTYLMALYDHPYEQSDYDLVIRTMCEKSTLAQNNKMPLTDLLSNLRDIPGIAPRDRGQILTVAEACWNLSRLGSDWREPLRITN